MKTAMQVRSEQKKYAQMPYKRDRFKKVFNGGVLQTVECPNLPLYTHSPGVVDHPKIPESAEVVDIERAKALSDYNNRVNDETKAYHAWLASYASLCQDLSMKRIEKHRKDDGKVKRVVVNNVLATWLLPGDRWGGRNGVYPTRDKAVRAQEESEKRRLRPSDTNLAAPDYVFTPEMSPSGYTEGFSQYGRPPSYVMVIADAFNYRGIGDPLKMTQYESGMEPNTRYSQFKMDQYATPIDPDQHSLEATSLEAAKSYEWFAANEVMSGKNVTEQVEEGFYTPVNTTTGEVEKLKSLISLRIANMANRKEHGRQGYRKFIRMMEEMKENETISKIDRIHLKYKSLQGWKALKRSDHRFRMWSRNVDDFFGGKIKEIPKRRDTMFYGTRSLSKSPFNEGFLTSKIRNFPATDSKFRPLDPRRSNPIRGGDNLLVWERRFLRWTQLLVDAVDNRPSFTKRVEGDGRDSHWHDQWWYWKWQSDPTLGRAFRDAQNEGRFSSELIPDVYLNDSVIYLPSPEKMETFLGDPAFNDNCFDELDDFDRKAIEDVENEVVSSTADSLSASYVLNYRSHLPFSNGPDLTELIEQARYKEDGDSGFMLPTAVSIDTTKEDNKVVDMVWDKYRKMYVPPKDRVGLLDKTKRLAVEWWKNEFMLQ